MHTKINWFEIPCTDFSRAKNFYEALFETTLKLESFGPFRMGIFPDDTGEGIGCIIHGDEYEPSRHGPVIYLDSPAPIDDLLAKVEPAGGKIKTNKTELPDDIGLIAHIIDTEGNRVALHQAVNRA